MYAPPRRPIEPPKHPQVHRYALGDEDDVGEFLESLGRPGRIIRAIADQKQRRVGRKSESAARKLIEAFGFETAPPKGTQDQGSDVARLLAAARRFLKQAGFEVVGAEPSRSAIEVKLEPPRSTDSSVVAINVDGRSRRFPKNHPIVTKEKVLTPGSTNVYWFLYDVDTRALYVKFDNPKTEKNPSKRPGPLYRYSNVSASVFLAMLEASSKGSFVWDNLRIRGTVSGHRYDYALVSVREGYVPRKATLMSEGEFLVERQIPTRNKKGQTKVLKSRPTTPAGVPNRGRPNRGRP